MDEQNTKWLVQAIKDTRRATELLEVACNHPNPKTWLSLALTEIRRSERYVNAVLENEKGD